MNIAVIRKKGYVKIYIDNLLHVSILSGDIIGFQSYLEGHTHCIKYYLRNDTKILCEYEDRKLWEAILNEIDKQNIL